MVEYESVEDQLELCFEDKVVDCRFSFWVCCRFFPFKLIFLLEKRKNKNCENLIFFVHSKIFLL